MGIEIERKFLVSKLPEELDKYPYHEIEQGYLNVRPAIRVRREDDTYYMTYKIGRDGIEGIGKTEYNMPLDEKSYKHMLKKADGNVITKRRYLIPLNDDAFSSEYLDKNPELSEMVKKDEIKVELDIFEGVYEGRILAEVEFPNEEAAKNYKPADWFKEDVTGDYHYSNSHMSREVL